MLIRGETSGRNVASRLKNRHYYRYFLYFFVSEVGNVLFSFSLSLPLFFFRKLSVWNLITAWCIFICTKQRINPGTYDSCKLFEMEKTTLRCILRFNLWAEADLALNIANRASGYYLHMVLNEMENIASLPLLKRLRSILSARVINNRARVNGLVYVERERRWKRQSDEIPVKIIDVRKKEMRQCVPMMSMWPDKCARGWQINLSRSTATGRKESDG